MEPRSRRLSSVSALHALSEAPVPDALVPLELLDPLVAASVPVVAPELADPGLVVPIEPPLDDDVPLLPYPEESVPLFASDPVAPEAPEVPELPVVPEVPELPLDSVALEDGAAGVLLPDDVSVDEPVAAGLSELIEPLVPRSDVAGEP